MRRRMIAIRKLLGHLRTDTNGTVSGNIPDGAYPIRARQLDQGWYCFAWEERDGDAVSLVVVIRGVRSGALDRVVERGA